MIDFVKVHNDGFVRYISHLGDDLSVVNCARVSYNKKKDEFGEKDQKLLEYLWENEHTSPFRHQYVSFTIRAPIFVLRQWMKHTIGCSWNEQSARYTELRHGFFRPSIWRVQDTNNKQSSLGEIVTPDTANDILDKTYNVIEKAYNELLALGVCREQARIVLPVGAYSECVWTASLQAIMHFLALRKASGAQSEIRDYAIAIETIVKQLFPTTIDLMN